MKIILLKFIILILFSDQNIIKIFENIKENEYVTELQEKNLTQYFIDTTNDDNEVKKTTYY